MTHKGKVYTTYDKDNPLAIYHTDDVDPRDYFSFVLKFVAEHKRRVWVEVESTEVDGYWMENLPEPDNRSEEARENEVLKAKLDSIRHILFDECNSPGSEWEKLKAIFREDK